MQFLSPIIKIPFFMMQVAKQEQLAKFQPFLKTLLFLSWVFLAGTFNQIYKIVSILYFDYTEFISFIKNNGVLVLNYVNKHCSSYVSCIFFPGTFNQIHKLVPILHFGL